MTNFLIGVIIGLIAGFILGASFSEENVSNVNVEKKRFKLRIRRDKKRDK